MKRIKFALRTLLLSGLIHTKYYFIACFQLNIDFSNTKQNYY